MNLQVLEHEKAPTRIIGVIRGSEKPSIFVPENDPRIGQWFYVNVPMIVRACNLPDNTPYVEDISEDVSAGSPYPLPKDVNTLIRYSVMPQDHLNYTLTWYVCLHVYGLASHLLSFGIHNCLKFQFRAIDYMISPIWSHDFHYVVFLREELNSIALPSLRSKR